ncbi:SecDF P1 head subdomain-containing protein [Paracandidimonas lactea]|uniref:SecDF P1 head subdomain-containing protein n=1 Tax=Paracandidimonas lactea TaxID=2895524 RepID=UPI001EF148C1|nr:hypothetical protein [Paracandidimonas lactea]
MKSIRTLSRLAAPLGLVILAACQTPAQKTATAPAAADTTAPASAQQQPAPQPAARQGAPVAVFLADTAVQTGWTPVDIPDGKLYVNPQPVITRADLSGVQAGTNKAGDGLLALGLNEEGKRKIVDITTKNPNKRLALVVGRTMLAAPGYSTPVNTEHLVFVVGTEQNATAAARAIAGVPQDGSGDAGAQTAPAQPDSKAPAGGGASTTPVR